MKRLGIALITLSMLLSVSCSNKDTTIILNEDTSNEKNLKYDITTNVIDYKVGKDESLIPSYYNNDDLHLWIGDSKGAYENGGLIDVNRIKFNTKTQQFTKAKSVIVNSIDNNSIVFNRYYRGMEPQEYGYLEYIGDGINEIKYEFSTASIDSKIDLQDGETISYGIWHIIGESGFYYRVGTKNISSNNSTRIVELHDFINNKTYYYAKEFQDSDEGVISYIDYSKQLNKFFGYSSIGEIFELELLNNEIKTNFKYRIPLAKDEMLYYENIYGVDFSLFSGSKFIYIIKNQNSRTEKVRVLDLESLKDKELDIKLNSDTENPIIRLSNDLVIINTKSNDERNDYSLVNLESDTIETIYKLSLDKELYIFRAIGNEDGTRFAATIYTKDNKFKELIEFKIEKLG